MNHIKYAETAYDTKLSKEKVRTLNENFFGAHDKGL